MKRFFSAFLIIAVASIVSACSTPCYYAYPGWEEFEDDLPFEDYCISDSSLEVCVDGWTEIIHCEPNEVCDVDPFYGAACYAVDSGPIVPGPDNYGNECSSNSCTDRWTSAICNNGWIETHSCYYGCDSYTGECKDPECSVNVCQGISVRICDDGIWGDYQQCQYGCDNGVCLTLSDLNKPSRPECSYSECLDENTLNECVNGHYQPQSCSYGCDNGACLPPTEVQCTESVCQDEYVLNECVGGVYAQTTCEHGCSEGACIEEQPAEKCTESVCHNETTLDECVDGTIVPKTCEHGCDKGACIEEQPTEKCTESVCHNETTLDECVDGTIVPRTCEHGCSEGACIEPECTESACSQDNQKALICNQMHIEEVVCDYKCDKGACIDDDTARCTDDSHLLMRDATEKYVLRTCEHGCLEGRCLDENQAICISDKDLSWGTYEERITFSCKDACQDGACLNGVACDTFKSVCTDLNHLLTCEDDAVSIKACEQDEICRDGACQKAATEATKCISETDIAENINGIIVEYTCAAGCSDNACNPSTQACIPSRNLASSRCEGNNVMTCQDEAETAKACDISRLESCVQDSQANASCRIPCDPDSYIAHTRPLYQDSGWILNQYECVKASDDKYYISTTIVKVSPEGFDKDGNPLIEPELAGPDCNPEEYTSQCTSSGFALNCVSVENDEGAAVSITDCLSQNKTCQMKDDKAECI